MATPMGFELLKQLFKKPATNVFPVTYYPDSILKLLEKVEKGEVKINPPVEIPKSFKGKIIYDRDECNLFPIKRRLKSMSIIVFFVLNVMIYVPKNVYI